MAVNKKRHQITSVAKDVGKMKYSCTVANIVNWRRSAEPLWRFLKTLKIQLPCDSAISLLGIYPMETKTQI